ncbi:MAG: HAD family hydrolase [Proteobacteria bacterium]|nr:HAD family hydrolase [Pseudomonadota bacterium]
MKRHPLLALDADGVLLDYLDRYADAWRDAFGARPAVRDPLGYGPLERWDVPRLDADGRARFRKHFGVDFWSSLPAMSGAVEACTRLHDAGFELVCVSALDVAFEASRLKNLRALGFPVERVYATPHDGGDRSPKADRLAALRPLAFVDDYLPYLRGVPSHVHTALIIRGVTGSPNVGPELTLAKSTHSDLAAFAEFWLHRPLR